MKQPNAKATSALKEVLSTEIRFLFFQRVKPDLKRLGNSYLMFGLVTAWLAGVGRYWDNPRAEWWQYAGLGSVAYIIVLALTIWLLIMPLRPNGWSYKTVLIFVGMTSPPAMLYAIPVERLVSISAAIEINVWFLAIVALWRVILYFRFLKFSARLSGVAIFTATFLPLTLIVTVLSVFNLEHVVFNIMAGNGPSHKSANDGAYVVLLLITTFSWVVFPVLLISYLREIYMTITHKAGRDE